MIGFNALGRMGRLANQMFQYASLKGIARNVGTDIIIAIKEPLATISFVVIFFTKMCIRLNFDFFLKTKNKMNLLRDPILKNF